MNLIFMRHGEATDNIKELLSDKEIYWSVLTEKGKKTSKKSIEALSQKIDKIYVSPFPRTIETAYYIFQKFPKTEVIIEKRLHEINYGKYSGKKNNLELDKTRLKQIEGDYFVRLGEYGENNFDIEFRLCEFLNDVYVNNFKENTIMIVSHGSVISYMKRILNIKTPHIKTGKIEEFNNIEFSDSSFDMFLNGIGTKNLIQKKRSIFDNGIILICFYSNFENFAEKWMNHYINIGIRNFVLVDNNSVDNSTNILKNYEKKVSISFWKIEEEYNSYKMCGWKQQILEFYGIGRNYLIVEADELFIYKDYKKILFEEFLRRKKVTFIKSLILDVYTNKDIFAKKIEDFKFVDKGTYKISTSVPYKQRFYGGPISRVFDINPSLQKIPFITYSGIQVFINNNYYYPWNINSNAQFCSYLLHYDISNNNITFYDDKYSIPIDNIDFIF